MSCINPIGVNVISNGRRINIEVPCGHCLPCMIKKESQITFLANKELISNYMRGKSASFVTLTYDDNHLPKNDSGFVTLCRSDLQKFLKRMRRNMEYHNARKDFKVLYCGEYGDGSHSTSRTGVSTCRPHYHIVFIGLSPTDVKYYTRKLWPFGLCDVGPLTHGGLRYLTKYMTKACPDKDVKELRSICDVQNPFFYHSIGLGKEWICNNLQKIVDDGFTFNLNGKINLFPKYVMQFVSAHTGVDYHPYVIKFLHKHDLHNAKNMNVSYQEYTFEKSFIHYKYMVAALRSQNKPINDFTLSKKWCRPNHSHDRRFSDLALEALNLGSVRSPDKPREKILRSSVSNYDGSINWQKYLDICYVREKVPF